MSGLTPSTVAQGGGMIEEEIQSRSWPVSLYQKKAGRGGEGSF